MAHTPASGTAPPYTLVSHRLCPYVQRAAIVLREKGLDFERIDIDLANKPDWFLAVSPMGKTPVLLVDDAAIFESAVICEYLDETQMPPLHPALPLARAAHRGWMEFASATLNDIAGLYSAPDEAALALKTGALRKRFAQLEQALALSQDNAPYFDGAAFSMVDAAFAPVFRYFDVIERIAGMPNCFEGLPRVQAWRASLQDRPSVRQAVRDDYPALLTAFLLARGSALSHRIQGRAMCCAK